MFVPRRFASLFTAGMAALIALAGCASPPAAPPPPPLNGALLVVRLQGLMEPPLAVQVDVGLHGQSAAGTSVVGRVQQSVPGQYADYLVALALPPNRYVLTAVRQADAAASTLPLATLKVPFEVTNKAPAYLGRLLVPSRAAAGTAGLSVEDRFDEDTVLFRSAIAELKTASIDRALITAESLAGSSVPRNEPAPAVAAMEVVPVSPASAELLAKPARGAFAGFLRLKPPRAFASNAAGGYGYARGSQAVDRALLACARRSKQSPCRVFAVDDTLITEGSCQATMQAHAKAGAIEAGCAGPAKPKTAGKQP